MLVKRFADADSYEAPNHWDVKGLRLQGFEDGGAVKAGEVLVRLDPADAERDDDHL